MSLDLEIKMIGPPYLFRYRPDNEHTLDEIEQSYIFFSDKESLNDPFDSSTELIQFVSENMPKNEYFEFFKKHLPPDYDKNFLAKHFTEEELIQLTINTIPKYLDSFGIACFSMASLGNMAMWANYSNNHQGVCIQYNSDYDKEFFSSIRPIKYVETLNSFNYNPIIDEHKITDVFFIKQKLWSYEMELRLIKMQKNKVPLKKDAIRNVFCGYRSKDEYIEKLVHITKENNSPIGIWKMDRPKKQYKVSLTKMN